MRMKWIVNLNLRAKLILLYFLTIFIPLLVTGQIILSVSGKKIIEQTTSITQESSAQTARNVKDRLGDYVDIVDRLSVDDTLINYLNPDRVYASELDSIDAYNLYLKPVTFYDFNYKNPLAELKILFLNKTLLQDYNIFIFADQEVQQREVYREAVRAGGKLVWGVTNGKVFIARSVYNIKKQLTAVISIQVPEDTLYALISETQESDKTVVIADQNGYAISSNDEQLVGRSVADQPYFRPDAAAPFDMRDSDSGRTYKVVIDQLGGESFPEWSLLTLIPIDRMIDDERKIRQTGLLVMGFGLVISCAIFLLALSRITDRVRKLVKKMQSVKTGELSLLEDEGVQDEIGALTRNFNGMIENLQRSIYANYEVNLMLKDITIKKQEAELYALQNQIHPHFLFNTLESIRMGLHNKGEAETAEVVLNFANLFRHLLNWQGEFIPLREEIDLVHKYLTVQKYRFRDRIQYELEVEPGLSESLIPKLTLQPLVENAVKHGVESVRNGRLRVKVRSGEKETMIAEIADNGVGIPADKLTRIREELSAPEIKKSGSIGLKNVHDRIQLHFGAAFGVSVESGATERGTLVRITMPVHGLEAETRGRSES